jgi:hypothetical protein
MMGTRTVAGLHEAGVMTTMCVPGQGWPGYIFLVNAHTNGPGEQAPAAGLRRQFVYAMVEAAHLAPGLIIVAGATWE